MDSLFGPTIIKTIMEKAGEIKLCLNSSWNYVCLFLIIEFSCLKCWYYVLYQSLIPNCKLTVNILKHQMNISSEVEVYILSGENSRLKCQRVVQFLLVCLDNERCYLKFCCQLSTVSVLSDLPYKLIRGKELF